MLRPSKHIHQIHALTGPENVGKVREIRHRRLAENRLRGGRDWNDAVTEPL
jgi:hypothetical protein